MNTVNSTSDERTTNNVMRHAYRVLNEDEKAQMQRLKDLGLEFYNLLNKIGGTENCTGGLASRELLLAATKIEEAVMWGVKHITR